MHCSSCEFPGYIWAGSETLKYNKLIIILVPIRIIFLKCLFYDKHSLEGGFQTPKTPWIRPWYTGSFPYCTFPEVQCMDLDLSQSDNNIYSHNYFKMLNLISHIASICSVLLHLIIYGCMLWILQTLYKHHTGVMSHCVIAHKHISWIFKPCSCYKSQVL